MKKEKLKGFTLAEVLITLSIIGIVAAITIPSLLANVDDKVYSAQKKALHARLAQAIGQFDKVGGYGKITKAAEAAVPASGTPGEAGYVPAKPAKPAEDNYAESFVIALSKVLKMNSFCVSTNLASCGIPGQITTMDGKTTRTLYSGSTAYTLGSINTALNNGKKGTDWDAASPDTKATYTDSLPAAFVTANGESVLVYYNTTCGTDPGQNQVANNKMCVNFLYDVNGMKAPNQVGKDIGFITVYSNQNSQVAGPIPAENDLPGTYTYENAIKACQANDDTTRLPDIDELTSLYVNKDFLGTVADGAYKEGDYWSGSAISAGTSGQAWRQRFNTTYGARWQYTRTNAGYVRCVRR